jgi:phospholipid/cholesterol/gamma-HCH transport system substrate-binding protein
MVARRRKQKKLELWIGLLVLVSAVLLLWGYFWLTGQPLGERGYTVNVVLPNAEGLERGDRVRLAGVEVGVVRSVELLAADRVALSLWLQRDLQLPSDTRVLLQSVGVFGDRIVVLQPGTAQTFAGDGDTLALGTTTGLMDLAGRIGDQARVVLERLERLLADSTIDQVHGGVAALPATIRDLDEMIRENSDEFAAMSRSLRRTAETLQQTLGGPEVDRTVADLQATAATLAETAERLKRTAEAISSVAEKIDRGEGTLGLLVNDPGLYQDLRSATQSLQSLTQDIQQNPGRYLKLAIF